MGTMMDPHAVGVLLIMVAAKYDCMPLFREKGALALHDQASASTPRTPCMQGIAFE